MTRQLIRYTLTPYGEAVLQEMERRQAEDLEAVQIPEELDGYRAECGHSWPPEVEQEPACRACGDTGLIWVLVGPDDAEREPCDRCDAWENRIAASVPIDEVLA